MVQRDAKKGPANFEGVFYDQSNFELLFYVR